MLRVSVNFNCFHGITFNAPYLALLEVHRYFRTLCGKLIKTEQGADKGLLGSSVKFLYSLDLQIKIMESRTDGEQVVIVQFRLTFLLPLDLRRQLTRERCCNSSAVVLLLLKSSLVLPVIKAMKVHKLRH